jgi:hypothetical protein
VAVAALRVAAEAAALALVVVVAVAAPDWAHRAAVAALRSRVAGHRGAAILWRAAAAIGRVAVGSKVATSAMARS